MARIDDVLIPSLTLEERASDGSDLTNPAADHRRLFVGEDGLFHLRDSAGNVTNISGGVADQGAFTYFDATEAAAPGTPAAGKVRLYAKSDGLLYSKDDAGVETVVTGGGGGSATDPTIPSGGTLYDGTSSSGWASVGSPTTFDVDTTVPGHFFVAKTTTANTNAYGAQHAVGGSFPRTYTMRLNDAWLMQDFAGAGIAIGETTPGKWLELVVYRNGTSTRLARNLYTTPSSVSAQTDFPAASDYKTTTMPQWLRFVVTSSTSIAGYFSRGGYLYYPLFTAYNPSMTVGSFGFSFSTFGAFDMQMAVDWIHES
jgi:hypothetical protein